MRLLLKYITHPQDSGVFLQKWNRMHFITLLQPCSSRAKFSSLVAFNLLCIRRVWYYMIHQHTNGIIWLAWPQLDGLTLRSFSVQAHFLSLVAKIWVIHEKNSVWSILKYTNNKRNERHRCNHLDITSHWSSFPWCSLFSFDCYFQCLFFSLSFFLTLLLCSIWFHSKQSKITRLPEQEKRTDKQFELR